MVTLKTMDLSIISLIILIFIYVNAYNRTDKIFIRYKLYINLIQINMLLIIIDILGWVFNGLSGTANFVFNTGFNLVLYMIEPLASTLWVLYAYSQVYHDESRLNNIKKTLAVFLLANAVFSVISLFTGWFFYVDAQNIYHRGQYFIFHVAYCYALIIYSLVFIIIHRSKLEKKYFISMLWFYPPLCIATVIQILQYGVSYNWTGMMLSLLIIYFNLQDRGLNTDYLTGVYNRRHLDAFIKNKIRNSTTEKTFSAIMFDLDKFKNINDQFGHNTGDEALKDAIAIIQRSLRHSDFIARVGGDEFIAIIDIDHYEMLEQKIQRIKTEAEKFNIERNKPYAISFSMGYDIYDFKQNMQVDDFLNHIDKLMYENKKSKA